MKTRLSVAVAIIAIVMVVLAVASYAFAYNVYSGYGENIDNKGLIGEQRGKGRDKGDKKKNVKPCKIDGTVKTVAGRTILLEKTDGDLALVVVPGALWYVEPDDRFVGGPEGTPNITELIKTGNTVKVIGVCIALDREDKETMRGIGGVQTVVIGGIIIDLTENIRINRVV